MDKKHKILLVGDSCTDVYVFGECSRLSPEAPVPIFVEDYRESRPGMASNVLKNMTSLGLNVDIITHQEEITKTRIVSSQHMHHLLRLDNEPHEIKHMSIEEINKIDIKEYDACVISDYDKGFIKNADASVLCKRFVEHQKPVFVDSKKEDLQCFESCIIKINTFENKKVVDFPQNFQLITTLGKCGASYNGTIFSPHEVQADERAENRDVCGAGDTFLAALVKMYLDTKSIEKSIPFANYCAAIVVNKFGVAVVNYDEVKKYKNDM